MFGWLVSDLLRIFEFNFLVFIFEIKDVRWERMKLCDWMIGYGMIWLVVW